jgi:hypothetical protein
LRREVGGQVPEGKEQMEVEMAARRHGATVSCGKGRSVQINGSLLSLFITIGTIREEARSKVSRLISDEEESSTTIVPNLPPTGT